LLFPPPPFLFNYLKKPYDMQKKHTEYDRRASFFLTAFIFAGFCTHEY